MKVTFKSTNWEGITKQQILDVNQGINTENFLNQLNVEVRKNPKRAKRLIQLTSSTLTTYLSALVQSKPILAAASFVKPTTTSQIDPDLLQIALLLIGAIAILSVLLALICLMLSGAWRMVFGGSAAWEWTVNILKGLGIVLAAPIVVFLMCGVFTLIFGNNPLFKLILEPINTVFHAR